MIKRTIRSAKLAILAERRDKMVRNIREKVHSIIDQISDARLEQVVDFLEYVRIKEEIEATNEIVQDKALYDAVKRGIEQIEHGDILDASDVIENV